MVRTLVTVAVTLVERALAAANIFSAALSEVVQPVCDEGSRCETASSAERKARRLMHVKRLRCRELLRQCGASPLYRLRR